MESDCAGLKGRKAAFISRNIRSTVSKDSITVPAVKSEDIVYVSRYSLLNLKSVFSIFIVAQCSNYFM